MKLITSILAILTATSLAQGPLAPPGAPAPTMKTLDEIHAVGEKRTPISSIPFSITQPGSYYLTGNLSTALAVDGISIDAKNVTIDLNGFRMTGNGAGLKAIHITNANVTTETLVVKNGTMTGWQMAIGGDSASIIAGSIEGVHIRDGFGIQLTNAKNVEVTRCVLENCTAPNNGIITVGRGGVVTNCRVTNGNPMGGLLGFADTAIRVVSHGSIRDCEVTVNGIIGIECDFTSTVRNCSVSGTGASLYGILVGDSATVDNCRVTGEFAYGVSVQVQAVVRGCAVTLTGSPTRGIVAGNFSQVSGCTVKGPAYSPSNIGVAIGEDSRVESNAVSGFDYCIKIAARSVAKRNTVGLANYGISATANNTIIEENSVFSCFTGIAMFTTGNMVFKNTLKSNGLAIDNLIGGNEVGPIGTPSTATSPFANLVY